MKLVLLTTIACNMAVAYAAEDRVGVRGFLDQLFGANQLQYVTIDKSGQPDYCYDDTEDPNCYDYKNGYPKCCTKEKGNCPTNEDNKPGPECDGDCHNNKNNCYDGYSNERDDNDNDSNRNNRDECSRDNDCDTNNDEYCSKREGECNSNDGLCLEKGNDNGNNRQEDPVCGCDGNSYVNPNAADYKGVSIDYDGCCDNDDSRDFCDSNNGNDRRLSCNDDNDCDNDDFCGQAQFGRCGKSSGVCLYWPRESECNDEGTFWVCGCDGNDYRNECYASAASVSVDYDGRCD